MNMGIRYRVNSEFGIQNSEFSPAASRTFVQGAVRFIGLILICDLILPSTQLTSTQSLRNGNKEPDEFVSCRKVALQIGGDLGIGGNQKS